MHMADALLSPTVGLAMDVVSVAAIGMAVKRIKLDEFSDKKVPIMGIAGALVFAGQMVNFTIPATGSSGHIGGGILLAGLLGGVPAFLSIAAVLIIQCLFFADGGLLALGCNIFNMGVVPCLFVYPLVFKRIFKGGANAKRLGVASVVSVVVGLTLGALGVTLQTLLSGVTALPFGPFVGLMLPIHLVIGLVEGLVTASILLFVHTMRPELIDASLTSARIPSGVSIKRVALVLIAATVLVGGGLSLAASSRPDGLEWAIGRILGEGEELTAEGAVFDAAAHVQKSTAFLPDYAFPNSESAAGTGVSGLVGAAITFVLAGAAGFVVHLVKKSKPKARQT